jgi:hypothetical protein
MIRPRDADTLLTGRAAQQRRGAADCGLRVEADGAVAEAVKLKELN